MPDKNHTRYSRSRRALEQPGAKKNQNYERREQIVTLKSKQHPETLIYNRSHNSPQQQFLSNLANLAILVKSGKMFNDKIHLNYNSHNYPHNFRIQCIECIAK